MTRPGATRVECLAACHLFLSRQPPAPYAMHQHEHLIKLYHELKRSFESRPSDLHKCGVLLSKLKVRLQSLVVTLKSKILLQVGLIQANLLPTLPQHDTDLNDLIVVREYLHRGPTDRKGS